MTSQNEDTGHDVIRPEADTASADEAHTPLKPEANSNSKHHNTGNAAEHPENSSTMKFRLRKAPKTAATSGEKKKDDANEDGNHWRRLRMTLKVAEAIQRHKKSTLQREDSFLKRFSTRNQYIDETGAPEVHEGDQPRMWSYPKAWRLRRHLVIQHDGSYMFYWLGIVTVAVLYNMWTCIAREAFREMQSRCHSCWFTLDAVSDVIYLLDIVVQFRTGYLDQGLMVYDTRKLARRYMSSRYLYVDTACLLPLDFLQFHIGIHPMIRFPRFLKVYRTFRFLHMLESRNPYPNLIRVGNLTHILFLGAHWFAAFYYLISEAEGFKGGWSYPVPEGEYASLTRKYLASLFWSTLTLTTIGDLPPPEGDWEYVFVIVSYLIGVFIFATIVGQVGNVITNRNASRQEFERLLDGAKVYMQTHNVPPDLQKRVQRWYDYVWSRGRLNGADINSLGLLPDKLKTELAIHVNLETLRKVTIFQECQPEFLHDLVLKMRAYIFTPGDLICRRGEVAREMFIIADGVVEIISESGTVLKQMGAGDFFGEIGILNLDGGINRRTADVRSVGFSELFVLSREDVLGALKDHPDAECIIRDYGHRRLREIEAHRQRVKPLQRQEAVNQLPTVHNNLLNSLHSMPSARRRQGQGDPAPPQSPRCAVVKGRRERLSNARSQASEDGPPGGGGDREGGGRQGRASLLSTVVGSLRRVFRRRTLGQKTIEETTPGSQGSKAAWGEEGGASEGRGKEGSYGNPRMAEQEAPAVEGGGGGGPLPSLLTRVIQQSRAAKPYGYQAVNTEDREGSGTEATPEAAAEAPAGENGNEASAKVASECPVALDLGAEEDSEGKRFSHTMQTTAGIESGPHAAPAGKSPGDDPSASSSSLPQGPELSRAGSSKADASRDSSTAGQEGQGSNGVGQLLRSLVRSARKASTGGSSKEGTSPSIAAQTSCQADSECVVATPCGQGAGNADTGSVPEARPQDEAGRGARGESASRKFSLLGSSAQRGAKRNLSKTSGDSATAARAPRGRQQIDSRLRRTAESGSSLGQRSKSMSLPRARRGKAEPGASSSIAADTDSSDSGEELQEEECHYASNMDLFAAAHLNGLGGRRGSLDKWRRPSTLPTIVEAESPSMRDLRNFMEEKLKRLEDLHVQSVHTLSRLADTQELLLRLLQDSLPSHNAPRLQQQNPPEQSCTWDTSCCEETRL